MRDINDVEILVGSTVVDSDNNKYTVYRHKNKINKKIYIGITKSKNVQNRWNNGKGYFYNKIFYNDILKYGWDNFEHDVLGVNLTQKDAYDMEKALIAYYNSTDKLKGYNISLGGNLWSAESKDKVSRTRTGKPSPQNKIYQYSIEGVLINVFNTRFEAKQKLPDVNFCCVSNCCRGVQKTHLGYRWSYYKF